MGSKHVLIVDDAIDLGRLLQEALKTANPGLPVVVVPSAEEAILESTRLSIDLLITDIRLPGMTGLDLVRKIRMRQPNIKVMVISGLAMNPSLKKQIDEINPDAFMHKPMSMPDFMDTAAALLGLDLLEGTPLQEEKKLARPVTGKLPPLPETEEEKLLKAALAQALPGVAAEELVVRRPALDEDEAGEPEREETGLAGILSGLRGSLGATAAILMDERGHPVAQAGDLPNASLMEQWAPAVIAALSSGIRLSYLLGENTGRAVQAYRGKEYDLVCAPVGQYTLLVVLKPGKSNLKMALAFEEALTAQGELLTALEAMGLHVRSALEIGAPEKLVAVEAAPTAAEKEQALEQLPEGPIAHDPGLEKFEQLLSGEGVRIDMDVDSFWDSASEKKDLELNTPGVLSFEQAQKLGLLPREDES